MNSGKKWLWVTGFALLVILLAVRVVYDTLHSEEPSVPAEAASPGYQTRGQETIVQEVRPASNYADAKVTREDIINGCDAGKDCIRSIDQPQFETVDQATWLKDDDRVVGLILNDEAHAYPARIIGQHELVNDTVGNVPVVVTYCTLCGTYYAFERVVDGRIITEFGASGDLQHSCMIMYDRYEGSLWQQQTGLAVVGEAARRDERLTLLATQVTTWKQWREAYPATRVLSRTTGYEDAFDYANGFARILEYENVPQLFFMPEKRQFEFSDRYDAAHTKAPELGMKETIIGLRVDEYTKAYRLADLMAEGTLDDTLGGANDIALQYNQTTGEITAWKRADNSKLVPERSFWFAWYMYYPETGVYGM